MFRSRWCVAVLAATVGLVARSAAAQVNVPPAEVAVGLTFNGLPIDVNAEPACASRAFPCTHAKPGAWGGLGLDVSIYGNLSHHTALVGGLEASGHNYDDEASLAMHRQAWNHVRAWLGGVRVSPGFDKVRRKPSQESDRLFVETLLGVETSTLFSTRQVVQIDVGADGHGRFLRGGREMTMRLALGYRAVPRGSRASQGFRFIFGVVLGPHF